MKKQKLNKEALEAYNAMMKLSEEEKQLVFRKVSQPDAPEPEKQSQKMAGHVPIAGTPALEGMERHLQATRG